MTYSLNQHNGYWASVMRGDMAKGRTAQTACNDTYRAILMMGRGQQEAMRVTQEAAQTPVAESGPASNSPFLFYASNDGSIKVQVMVEDETVWASQKGMAEIFGVDVRTVSEHLQNIFVSGELDELSNSVIRKFRITAFDGKAYETGFYSLDAIISVGYRVNSIQATQFTPWPRPPYLDTATNVETVFTIAQVYAIQRDAMRAALEAAANVVEASPSYDWHRFACESAYAIRALDAA